MSLTRGVRSARKGLLHWGESLGVMGKIFTLTLFIASGACLTTQESVRQHMSLEASSTVELAHHNGHVLISNLSQNTIEKVNLNTKERTRFVGHSDFQPGSDDGPALSARLNAPRGLAVYAPSPATDPHEVGGQLPLPPPAPRLFVLDSRNCTIREIELSNLNDSTTLTVKTVAGQAGNCSSRADGVGSAARLGAVLAGLIVGEYLYFSDPHFIRRMNVHTYAVETVAGVSTPGLKDGEASQAQFREITGMTAVGRKIYVSDTSNNRIRVLDLETLVVSTLAGSSTTSSGDSATLNFFPSFLSGTGENARFKNPYGLTGDGARYLYVTDRGNNAIRRVDVVTTVVETVLGHPSQNQDLDGRVPGGSDGRSPSAATSAPSGIVFTNTGIYFANSFGLRRLK